MAVNIALETTMGTITLELYTSHAPKTCTNFETLIRRGYYDGIIFHRIIPNFMLQTGDPTGTGRGGSSIYGEKFADELTPPPGSNLPIFYYAGADAVVGWEAYDFWTGDEGHGDGEEDGACEDGGGG
ncbi:hypothetical protein QC760_004864 [Botrytis cinerea]